MTKGACAPERQELPLQFDIIPSVSSSFYVVIFVRFPLPHLHTLNTGSVRKKGVLANTNPSLKHYKAAD